MENMDNEQQRPYSPRPIWQVWLARLALAVFLILIVLYYLNIARGGI